MLFFFLKIQSRDAKIEESLNSLQKKLDFIQKELAEKPKTSTQSFEKTDNVFTESKPPIVPHKPNPIVEKPVEQHPVSQKPPVNEPVEVVARIEMEPKSIRVVPPVPKVPEKSWFATFKDNNPDLEKFIGENLINKIGILILVLGISFFVKYAIAKDWINEPARVGIGVLCGALVMGVAHKLKKNFAAFSSVLVAGAISIFYFTIAIAFHEYHLFSQTVAFAIMTVITIFSVLVSVAYNRQELAVLSLIGGFAVPFMISTGAGNYVVLFSYIAILNSGILAIAYFKKWKIVTILAFIFTCILFGSWYTIELYDDKLPHSGAFIFATVFYFIFSLAVVISNIRNKGIFSVPEYIIMVANTFFFFGVGMGIIHNWGLEIKGFFTLALAIYNVIYAAVLYRKFGLDKNAIYLLIGLALTFITLTIPLQFEGNQITLFWAAESVLLFWLSQKSKIERFKWSAAIVQVLTLLSLVMDWFDYDFPTKPLQVILNATFISGIFVTLSLFATFWLLQKENIDKKVAFFSMSIYKASMVVLAILTAYITGYLEVNYQAFRFVTNTASASAFTVAYHFIFIVSIVFAAIKLKKESMQRVLLLVGAFSIVLYIARFYALPSDELIQNFVLNSTTQYAFYLHYITLLCLIYLGYQLYKKAKQVPKIAWLHYKITPWLFVFATVYILSNEVMIHGLKFSADSADVAQIEGLIKQNGNEFSTYSYEKEMLYKTELNKLKTLIIKIGYPIVWGLFSFVFLIIGIKKQWKNLRIIALSLLGITILKLFLYDIRSASETGKIIAFIILGVVILVISFVYQKVKKLVVDDASNSNSHEEVS